ncbi:glycosyltransferase, partial [bacterium]|nr:glycosyltransferase [bacterium]
MAQISVIVPVYQVEADLPQCIDSILAQTFRDFELILVDDGSPDESGRFCDEWAETHPNARVIHQQNQGLSGARNTGI